MAKPKIGFVEFDVESQDDFVLRALDMDDGPILIDVEELSFGQTGCVLPFAVEALLV